MDVHSLTKNLKPEALSLEPFPHIVADNVLDEHLYEELEKTYPFESRIDGFSGYANNARYQISAVDALRETRVSSAWKEFIAYHISADFWRDITSFFTPAIQKYYPDLNTSQRVGTRFIDRDADFWMDCQPGMNSPVSKMTSVKGPHVDHPAELFAGLLYFRHPDDDSTGGDLDIYRYRSEKYSYRPGRFVDERFVEKVKSVKYGRNRLVLFLNTIDSVHGVSLRAVTSYTRRLCNFVGESGHGTLFSIPTKVPVVSRAKALVRRVLH